MSKRIEKKKQKKQAVTAASAVAGGQSQLIYSISESGIPG